MNRPSRRGSPRVALLVVCGVLTASSLAPRMRAQSADSLAGGGVSVPRLASEPTRAWPDTSKTFFTRRDLTYVGVALAASAATSLFDERIAHWTQHPSVQGSQKRHDLVNTLTKVNETPLTIAAVATYGVGRLFHSPTVSDVGAHWSEAMVLTVAISEAIRSPLGRVRPRSSPDDAFNFEFGGGFTKFDDRSFPSLHAAAGFATASVLVGEIRDRRPGALPYAAPLLYAGALVPGLTRMYLNQHWASDVVAGAFLGTLLGSRVVHYAHTHQRTRLDRVLLGTSVLPGRSGGVQVVTTVPW